MKILFLIIAFSFVYLFISTQQNAKPKEVNPGIIASGMTQKEVIAAIGEPYFEKETYWWYPVRKFIFFKDGIVTGATFPLGAPRNEL